LLNRTNIVWSVLVRSTILLITSYLLVIIYIFIGVRELLSKKKLNFHSVYWLNILVLFNVSKTNVRSPRRSGPRPPATRHMFQIFYDNFVFRRSTVPETSLKRISPENTNRIHIRHNVKCAPSRMDIIIMPTRFYAQY